MSLSLAVLVSDRRLLPCVCQACGSDIERFLRPAATSEPETGDPGQLGFGYYEQGEVLLSRRPLNEKSSLARLLCETPTRCMLAHVTGPTSGGFRPDEAQPFRYRDWLWSQSGALREKEGFDRRTVAIPSYIRGNLKTWCPEEVVFHLFLAFLHRTGTLGTLHWDRAETRKALSSAVSLVGSLYDAEDGSSPSSFSILATNGEVVFGVGVGRPLAIRRQDGIASCGRCAEQRDVAVPRTQSIDHPHLRAVLLADHVFDEGADGAEAWEVVEPGTIVEIDGGLGVEHGPLEA